MNDAVLVDVVDNLNVTKLYLRNPLNDLIKISYIKNEFGSSPSGGMWWEDLCISSGLRLERTGFSGMMCRSMDIKKWNWRTAHFQIRMTLLQFSYSFITYKIYKELSHIWIKNGKKAPAWMQNLSSWETYIARPLRVSSFHFHFHFIFFHLISVSFHFIFFSHIIEQDSNK